MIHDPRVVEALYTTKNKFFSKHPFLKDLYNVLLGDSILFAETTPEWRESRKVISPAFYKGKLENLVLIARDTMRTTVKVL
jgi:cytochrome P450